MTKFLILVLVLNCTKINLSLNSSYKEFEIEKEIIRIIKKDDLEEFEQKIGDDINKPLDIDKSCALHYCAEFNASKITEFLLRNDKIDVNIQAIQTLKGRKMKKASPLHIACYQGHKNLVKMFIDKGADTNAEACGGYTPQHYAAISGNRDCLELLVNEKNINIREKENGGSLIYYAALVGNEELVKWLKEKGANIDLYDYKGYTAAHRAIIEECPKALGILIRNGANMSLKGEFGVTSLYLAAKRNSFNNNVKEIIELLLNNGCEIDEKSQNSWTPLSAAIINNNFSLVEFLLKNGANIKEDFDFNITTAINKGNKRIVLLFLKNLKSSEINIQSENLKFETLIDAMKELNLDINKTQFKNGLNVLQAIVESNGTKKELLYATERSGASIRFLKGNQLLLYNKIFSTN